MAPGMATSTLGWIFVALGLAAVFLGNAVDVQLVGKSGFFWCGVGSVLIGKGYRRAQDRPVNPSDAKNVMTYKGYSARIEYDDEDGILFGQIAGIRDGVSFHGESVDDLRAAFHEAVDDYLETCARLGKEPKSS